MSVPADRTPHPDAANQPSPFDPTLVAAKVQRSMGFAIPFTPDDIIGLVSTPDGSARVSELAHTLGLAGFCFATDYGQANTYITGKVVGNYLATEPDTNLDIPAGTCVIPLGMNVSCGAMTGTLNHFWITVGQGVVGNGTSTAATIAPQPLSPGLGFPSKCTARQAYSAAGTAPTLPLEVFSWDMPTTPAATAALQFAWAPVTFAPIVGPACISGYSIATTTAFTFKAQLLWAELPATYAN